MRNNDNFWMIQPHTHITFNNLMNYNVMFIVINDATYNTKSIKSEKYAKSQYSLCK